MRKVFLILLTIVMLASLVPVTSVATTLPLAQWSNFEYAGAFRVPSGDPVSGSDPAGRFLYSQGGIGLSSAGNMYVQGNPGAGYNDTACIAEITIPTLDPYDDTLVELPTGSFLQGFLNVFDNVPTGNPQANDKACYIYEHNGYVIGTAIKYYDAAADNTHFLYRADDPSDLVNSNVGGFYTLTGYTSNGYEAAGWITPVPEAWQSALGFEHLIGHADNWSIGGRASNGPSFFGIDLDDVTAPTVSQPISITPCMNFAFSQGHALFKTIYPTMNGNSYTDFNYNCVKEPNPVRVGSDVDFPDQGEALGNDVWTEASTIGYAFIVPGTRTYACIGYSGGHNYGMGYKIVRDEDFTHGVSATYVSSNVCTVSGNLTLKYTDKKRVRSITNGTKAYSYCYGNATYSSATNKTTIRVIDAIFTSGLDEIDYGLPTSGPACYVASDWSHFYWFFDMDDIVDAKNGVIDVNEVTPYAYGPIDTPFELVNGANAISEIRSGTFDPANNRLYLSIRQGDGARPLIFAYDINVN